MKNLIETIDALYTFILGGFAIFTIVNTKTDNRFTYKIVSKEVSEGKTLFFVSVLTGQDNENDYSFLGTIFDNGNYYHGRKSRISKDAQSAKAFQWLLNRLENHQDLGPVEAYHEGRCGRCGRKLTTPESIQNGFGPICRSAVLG